MACVFSCKKDVSSVSLDKDSPYKQKVQTLLNLKPIDEQTLKLKNDSGIVNFKFNSYEEFYEYFKFMENKVADTIITDVVMVPSFNFKNYDLLSNGVQYETYATGINSSAGVSRTFGTGTVNAMYQVSVTIGYNWTQTGSTKVFTSKQFMSSSTGGVSLFYAGVGTATGTALMNSYSQSGTLVGNMQGTATVGGVTWSFIISVSGGYNANPPPTNNPAPSITISQYLSATST